MFLCESFRSLFIYLLIFLFHFQMVSVLIELFILYRFDIQSYFKYLFFICISKFIHFIIYQLKIFFHYCLNQLFFLLIMKKIFFTYEILSNRKFLIIKQL